MFYAHVQRSCSTPLLHQSRRFLTSARHRLRVGEPTPASSRDTDVQVSHASRGHASRELGKRALVSLWEPAQAGVTGGAAVADAARASAASGSAFHTRVSPAIDVVNVECVAVPPAQACVIVTLRNIGATACAPHFTVVAADRRPLTSRCVCQPHAIVSRLLARGFLWVYWAVKNAPTASI